MPATEQTWRDQKVMHLVFGLSALAMLGATVWMLADDHNREWKVYQSTFQDIEDWSTAAQIAEEDTHDYLAERARLDLRLYQQQLVPPSQLLVDRFIAEVLFDRYLAVKPAPASTDQLVERYTALRALPLEQLSRKENLRALDEVIAELRVKVPDSLGIEAAYKRLLEVSPPAPTKVEQPVASTSPSLKQRGDEQPAAPAADGAGGSEASDSKSKESSAKAPAAAPSADQSEEPKIDAELRERVVAAREALFSLMRDQIAAVKFVEDDIAQKRKFRRADADAARSQMDIAVRDSYSPGRRAEIQSHIDRIVADVNEMTLQYEQAAAQRARLETLYRAITGPEDRAQKNLKDFEAGLEKLRELHAEQESVLTRFWRGVLEMPILDAFSPRLKIDQIWLPKLTLNNNFRDVARFDRCTTCHLAVDKTAPGSATDPAYAREMPPLTISLETPAEAPAAQTNPMDSATSSNKNSSDQLTQRLYGLLLAQRGMLKPEDVTVEVVWPKTPAARAGLKRGDVITHVLAGNSNVKITRREQVLRYLLEQVEWGQPIQLTVRRGLPHPYATHPRLDLFVGSLSPHKKQVMGCTICHQGQGSATSFQWASHTPNSLPQEAEWFHEYGYAPNHHWIFPMYPNRFIESSCLKCHHDVVDLKPSPRFPEPPAPKVMAGFDLVQKLGCYGCHEIIGYDGPKRIGPDLRNEPMYYAAAAQLALDLPARVAFFEKLKAESAAESPSAQAAGDALADLSAIGELSAKVSSHPEDTPARLRLLDYLSTDAARAAAPTKLLADPGLTIEMFKLAQQVTAEPDDVQIRAQLCELLAADQTSSSPQLQPDTYNLIPALRRPPELTPAALKLMDQIKTAEAPGTLRKVGPSLRHVASKLGEGTLNRWIYNPRDIRPSTKMPRFFGLMDELTPDAAKTAARYEPIEARAMAQYLIDYSQPFKYDEPSASVTEKPSVERGELLFKTRGCLACHQHSAVAGSTGDFGPQLTDLAKKIRTEKGQEWLYSWLRHPDRYHLRTAMPYNFLHPLPLTDAQGAEMRTAGGQVRMTDPAADIAAWLLGAAWKPENDPFTTFVDNESADTAPYTSLQLDHEVLKYLSAVFPEEAPRYAKEGIPADIAAKLAGPEARLTAPLDNKKKASYARAKALDALTLENLMSAFPEAQALEYLQRGIPAELSPTLKGAEVELVAPMSEQKKLNYVGRRAISKYGCSGCHDIPGFESARPIGTGLADWGRKETSKLAFEHILEYLPKEQAHRLKAERQKRLKRDGDEANGHAQESSHDDGSHGHLSPEAWGPEGYFVAALMQHQREGFLWQKLREPRSYDYMKTENKRYNEWLRMPQFNLTEEEREQIMTFVLGLVTEPPAAEYVYQPDARAHAVIEGEKVLAKFNCAGCHVLDTARWGIEFAPDSLEASSGAPLPPFLRPHFTMDEVQSSKLVDRRGLARGTIHGMPKVTPQGYPDYSVFMKTSPDSPPEFISRTELDEDPPPTDPRGYSVELWKATLLDGKVFQPKDPLPLLATAPTEGNPIIVDQSGTQGGEFAWQLLPIAIESQKQGEGADAWAWVPPPLVGQGRKTQPEWLHDFLLDPQPIRPGVVLRMPRFNMSSDDAKALVNYFAARDNDDYPHQFGDHHRTRRLAADEAAYQAHLKKLGLTGTRFGDAEKIILNKSGCITCHLVGDFKPEGSDRALAPNLDNVYRRLQGDWVRRWVAKPDLILPYTKMPVNFPYHPEDPAQDGFWQQIEGTMQRIQPYHGTSLQQIDAVSDLLMNWDRYMEGKTSIRRQVQASGATPPPQSRSP